jgi:hypothetical protein
MTSRAIQLIGRLPAHLMAAGVTLTLPLYIDRGGWHALLATAQPRGTGAPQMHALRTSLRLLRVLSWLPRSPWRTTCFYRSVAVCRVMRQTGVDAVLKIGAMPGSEVKAHAWVESTAGDALYEARGEFQPLS